MGTNKIKGKIINISKGCNPLEVGANLAASIILSTFLAVEFLSLISFLISLI